LVSCMLPSYGFCQQSSKFWGGDWQVSCMCVTHTCIFVNGLISSEYPYARERSAFCNALGHELKIIRVV
ncbi:hypothetical protein, partial [Anaplasma phagocytophilum]